MSIDSIRKRASSLGEGLVIPDGSNLATEGERRSAEGLYYLPAEDGGSPEPGTYTFTGRIMAVQACLLTGLLSNLQIATVRAVPTPETRSTTFADLVRQAEGPVAYAKRDRYVAYEFGGAAGRKRQFWDGPR